jgi:low affinity Fe/Cu permease
MARAWCRTQQARFACLAMRASVVAGSAGMFLGSLLCFALWLVWGQIGGWTETVHLWPTSLLTWFTWILVVLVQHSQTRQEAAIQAKLDELIYAVDKADNQKIGLEKQPPDTGE